MVDSTVVLKGMAEGKLFRGVGKSEPVLRQDCASLWSGDERCEGACLLLVLTSFDDSECLVEWLVKGLRNEAPASIALLGQ